MGGGGGGGGAVQSDKKSSDNVVFCVCFFLVLSLFYGSEMVIFKEIYHFQGSRGGPTFSRGGEGGPAPCPPPPPPGSALGPCRTHGSLA